MSDEKSVAQKLNPFQKNMISLLSVKLLSANKIKVPAFQIQDNTDIPYFENTIDYEAINNYVNLSKTSKTTISKIYDQSGNDNNAIQPNVPNQAITNEEGTTYNYFKFDKESYYTFEKSNPTSNSFALAFKFNVPENVDIANRYLFSYIDKSNQDNLIYAVRFNENSQIELVLNNNVEHTIDYKKATDMLFLWSYDVIGGSLVYSNKIDFKSTKKIKLENGEPFLCSNYTKRDSNFIGALYSFGYWDWSLVVSEMNYIVTKF